MLDKCSKYIDGVIYNIEISLEEEEEQQQNSREGMESKISEKEELAYHVKRSTFLIKCYLQYCAIISQLG